jgi:hypothetical protein
LFDRRRRAQDKFTAGINWKKRFARARRPVKSFRRNEFYKIARPAVKFHELVFECFDKIFHKKRTTRFYLAVPRFVIFD